MKGHVDVVKTLLNSCPDSRTLIDHQVSLTNCRQQVSFMLRKFYQQQFFWREETRVFALFLRSSRFLNECGVCFFLTLQSGLQSGMNWVQHKLVEKVIPALGHTKSVCLLLSLSLSISFVRILMWVVLGQGRAAGDYAWGATADILRKNWCRTETKSKRWSCPSFWPFCNGSLASSSFQLLPRFHWLESLQETFRVEQQTFLGVDAKQRLKQASRTPPKGTLECQTIWGTCGSISRWSLSNICNDSGIELPTNSILDFTWLEILQETMVRGWGGQHHQTSLGAYD